MWGEFVLVLVFFAALFFPYMESTAYFYGTSIWDLSAIAVLGTVAMIRQSTSARMYTLLSRLSSRSAYSRGLMLATGVLRVPLFLFFCILVLAAHRLTDLTPGTLLVGMLGLLPITMLVSTLTVALTSPIGSRRKLMVFLVWVALVLFSISPVVLVPDAALNVLSIVRIPLAPITWCYGVSVSGYMSMDLLWGTLGVAVYVAGLGRLAGYWLEKKELLLF